MIKYKAKFKSKDICVCIVDDTDQYDSWTRELVKNRADYTITNCTGMDYDVYVDRDIDNILTSVSDNYRVAVIISPGTEFVNGDAFFNNIPKNFSLIGHILDAGESYYILHPQCYVLNLEIFNSIGKPEIGKHEYFKSFSTTAPCRSNENIHDDYTPLWIKPGEKLNNYKHRGYGYNLIKSLLDNNFTIEAFDTEQRKNKHYLYTDINTSDWIYKRYNYCLTDHIYKTNTGGDKLPIVESPIRNLIVPAAGMNWYNTIKKYGYSKDCLIKFYDYNISSLDWIKNQTQNITNINFEYHRIDVLTNAEDFLNLIDNHTQYVEFSNIFSYEPTAALIPLKHRLQVQNDLIKRIATINSECYIHFDQRVEDGFIKNIYSAQKAKDILINQWKDLCLPPWHTYS
jgi:hypothetical protein